MIPRFSSQLHDLQVEAERIEAANFRVPMGKRARLYLVYHESVALWI
jgi:hypothetical protein